MRPLGQPSKPCTPPSTITSTTKSRSSTFIKLYYIVFSEPDEMQVGWWDCRGRGSQTIGSLAGQVLGFIIINWIRREESPLSDPETARRVLRCFFAIFQSEMQFSPFNFECPRFRAVPRQSNLIEMGSLISFFGASKVHNTIMCIGK